MVSVKMLSLRRPTDPYMVRSCSDVIQRTGHLEPRTESQISEAYEDNSLVDTVYIKITNAISPAGPVLLCRTLLSKPCIF